MSPFSTMLLERAALLTVVTAAAGGELAVTEPVDELGIELGIVEVIKVLDVTGIEVVDGVETGVVVMDVVGVGVGVGVVGMVVSGAVVAGAVVSGAVVGVVVSEVVVAGVVVPRADVVDVVVSGAEVVVPVAEVLGVIVSDVVLGIETGPGPNTEADDGRALSTTPLSVSDVRAATVEVFCARTLPVMMEKMKKA